VLTIFNYYVIIFLIRDLKCYMFNSPEEAAARARVAQEENPSSNLTEQVAVIKDRRKTLLLDLHKAKALLREDNISPERETQLNERINTIRSERDRLLKQLRAKTA